MKILVKFWLQETKSFLSGAPQREEYDTDKLFHTACTRYQREWLEQYNCTGCNNPDCPQCHSQP